MYLLVNPLLLEVISSFSRLSLSTFPSRFSRHHSRKWPNPLPAFGTVSPSFSFLMHPRCYPLGSSPLSVLTQAEWNSPPSPPSQISDYIRKICSPFSYFLPWNYSTGNSLPILRFADSNLDVLTQSESRGISLLRKVYAAAFDLPIESALTLHVVSPPENVESGDQRPHVDDADLSNQPMPSYEMDVAAPDWWKRDETELPNDSGHVPPKSSDLCEQSSSLHSLATHVDDIAIQELYRDLVSSKPSTEPVDSFGYGISERFILCCRRKYALVPSSSPASHALGNALFSLLRPLDSLSIGYSGWSDHQPRVLPAEGGVGTSQVTMKDEESQREFDRDAMLREYLLQFSVCLELHHLATHNELPDGATLPSIRHIYSLLSEIAIPLDLLSLNTPLGAVKQYSSGVLRILDVVFLPLYASLFHPFLPIPISRYSKSIPAVLRKLFCKFWLPIPDIIKPHLTPIQSWNVIADAMDVDVDDENYSESESSDSEPSGITGPSWCAPHSCQLWSYLHLLSTSLHSHRSPDRDPSLFNLPPSLRSPQTHPASLNRFSRPSTTTLSGHSLLSNENLRPHATKRSHRRDKAVERMEQMNLRKS